MYNAHILMLIAYRLDFFGGEGVLIGVVMLDLSDDEAFLQI